MSELGYIVRVNGLFNIPDKSSKKVGKGLMEQIRDGEPHQYDELTAERLRQVIEEVFSEVGETPRTSGITLMGTSEGLANFQQQLDQSFRDQLITNTSSITSSIVQSASLMDRTVPYQNMYNIAQTRIGSLIGEERDRQHEVSPSQEGRRRLVLNTLQRQLQQGEISMMDYLDLISQQE